MLVLIVLLSHAKLPNVPKSVKINGMQTAVQKRIKHMH